MMTQVHFLIFFPQKTRTLMPLRIDCGCFLGYFIILKLG